MFDVGDRDLPVPTSGKCRVVKWPLKYVGLRFVNVFLSCCTRFLEHWPGKAIVSILHMHGHSVDNAVRLAPSIAVDYLLVIIDYRPIDNVSCRQDADADRNAKVSE